MEFEHADETKAALRAMVSDPAHGADVLASPELTANLLRDFLPDAPRETGLLVAAVSAGIPAALRGYEAERIDPATAVRLAAALLAARTAFTPEACEWVAAELMMAIGFAGADDLAVTRPPGGPAGIYVVPGNATLIQPAVTERLAAGVSLHGSAPATALPAGSRSWKRLALALGVVVLAMAAVVGFGAGYVYSRQSAIRAAGSPLPVASSRQTATACTRRPLSRALAVANPQLKSFSWHVRSFACQDGWAAVTMYAPSVGAGEAFLRQAASGWTGGALDGGVYGCSDLQDSFDPPVPPQALASALFTKVGLCPNS